MRILHAFFDTFFWKLRPNRLPPTVLSFFLKLLSYILITFINATR